MKEDMLTSGTFIWIHQELFLIPEALWKALNLCPHLENHLSIVSVCLCFSSMTSCTSLIDKVNIAPGANIVSGACMRAHTHMVWGSAIVVLASLDPDSTSLLHVKHPSSKYMVWGPAFNPSWFETLILDPDSTSKMNPVSVWRVDIPSRMADSTFANETLAHYGRAWPDSKPLEGIYTHGVRVS